ncbi:HAD-IIB family hydrolase [Streptococcus panodentis]|nr:MULTISPECIES: HAD-IIB family hydrolase [Streptococcus]KXT85290.1 hypothetical protein STRDD11_00423 [Streptococcus sp. DD11]
MTDKKIKLFIDIDGTFVFDSSAVASEDLKAFRAASHYSQLIIATGRSLKEITYVEEVNDLSLDYKVAFNGGYIVDAKGQVLEDRQISKERLKDLIQYLKNHGVTFDALDNKERFGNFKQENQNELLGLNYDYMDNPYDEALKRTVYKINLRPDDLEQACQITKDLKALFPDLSIFRVGKRRIEISANHTSKGQALEQLSKGSFSVAIGDSENDTSMFDAATISYCMAHAPEDVKAHATYVVPRFRDAIYHLIEHFIKEKAV